MGFIFGLLLGAAVFAGGDGRPATPSILSGIPLRCYAALDHGDNEYRDCRRATMSQELNMQSAPTAGGNTTCSDIWFGNGVNKYREKLFSNCDVEVALTLEIEALRALEKKVAEKKPHG
ncbi:MAG TPA: hypothetical protein VKT73_15425 [Xanthobacteraceae bacterium]|nr:hypothetical protein [Xanthobacteraceae bacterium]